MESRYANTNNNKIKVRVVSPSVFREVEVVPSMNLGSYRNVPSCYHPSELLKQNYMNVKRSGEPVRFLSYRNGSWVDIEREVFDALKLGVIEGRSVEVKVGGRDCIFDLYRMLQTDVVSWKRRSIAWFDVSGQPFFPKVFVDEDEGDENVQLPNIEVEIKIPENESSSNKKKCVRVKNEEVSSSNVVQRPLWAKTRLLSQEEQAYKAVQSMFLSGVGSTDPRAKITRIHQWIRNGPIEKARFEVFQMQLELTKKIRGDAKVVLAWYGGTSSEVGMVLSHGFRTPTKFPGSAPHGTGVYLTRVKLPHLSAMFSEPDDNEERHVILCRVILGNCEKVEAGSKQSFPSSTEYDTGVDDLMNPKWYIVWVPNMNTLIIPECVVSFKTAGTGRGVPPGLNRPPEYLKKLKRFLTPEKSKEVDLLCTALMEGKMDRDVFCKMLPVVVGDDVIRMAMREST